MPHIVCGRNVSRDGRGGAWDQDAHCGGARDGRGPPRRRGRAQPRCELRGGRGCRRCGACVGGDDYPGALVHNARAAHVAREAAICELGRGPQPVRARRGDCGAATAVRRLRSGDCGGELAQPQRWLLLQRACTTAAVASAAWSPRESSGCARATASAASLRVGREWAPSVNSPHSPPSLPLLSGLRSSARWARGRTGLLWRPRTT